MVRQGMGSPKSLAQLLGKVADDMAKENAPWNFPQKESPRCQVSVGHSKRKNLQHSSRDKRPRKNRFQ